MHVIAGASHEAKSQSRHRIRHRSGSLVCEDVYRRPTDGPRSINDLPTYRCREVPATGPDRCPGSGMALDGPRKMERGQADDYSLSPEVEALAATVHPTNSTRWRVGDQVIRGAKRADMLMTLDRPWPNRRVSDSRYAFPWRSQVLAP